MEIVATLGPASFALADALHLAGATAFRLNASHMDPAELGRRARDVSGAVPGLPLIVDLQGAKLRLGEFPDVPVRAGQRVRLCLHASGDGIPLPHPEVFAAVAPGDTLSSDDARLRFRVVRVSADTIEASALDEGTVRARKGINVLEHPVELSGLTEQDSRRAAAAASAGVTAFAFSFMTDGRETEWLRGAVPGCSVAGKIERREAARNLDRIADAVDAVWICRGDLGAQLGPAALARFVAGVRPDRYRCPVLMAGQVLEHMTRHAAPTRSEICHLFDLVSRDYAGFVLSDETAVGADPVGAVRALRGFLDELEEQH